MDTFGSEPKAGQYLGVYCFDLLCRLTCSAVRRMRRLIASCSLRANASITAMSFAVGVGLSRKSARRSQGTRKSSLPVSVEASGAVAAPLIGRGSDFFNGISTVRQRSGCRVLLAYSILFIMYIQNTFPSGARVHSLGKDRRRPSNLLYPNAKSANIDESTTRQSLRRSARRTKNFCGSWLNIPPKGPLFVST